MRRVMLLASVAALAACTSQGLPPVSANGLYAPRVRPTAPPLAGPAVSGSAISPDRGSGHVQVINFWGSWCGPCRAEASELSAAATQTSKQGVVFLGVDTKEERAAAARFERRHELPYPSVFDQSGILISRFRRFAPTSTPTTMLVDRHGRIARVLPGAVTAAEIMPLIQALQAEP